MRQTRTNEPPSSRVLGFIHRTKTETAWQSGKDATEGGSDNGGTTADLQTRGHHFIVGLKPTKQVTLESSGRKEVYIGEIFLFIKCTPC